MTEIAVRCLWHEFTVQSDDDALVAQVRSSSPEADACGDVAVRVRLRVAHPSSDSFVLYDGADRWAETATRDEACRLLVDRMALRALEMAGLRGWLPFSGVMQRHQGATGPVDVLVMTDPELSVVGWFLTDGTHVVDVSEQTALPALRRPRMLVHRVGAASPGGPLSSIEAARVLVTHAGEVPEDRRRDVVRMATSLASSMPSYSVAAASLAEVDDAVRALLTR